MTRIVSLATDHPPRGTRVGTEAIPEGSRRCRRRRPHRGRCDWGGEEGDGGGGGGASGARQATARARGTGRRCRVHFQRPHGAVGRHRGAEVLRVKVGMKMHMSCRVDPETFFEIFLHAHFTISYIYPRYIKYLS